jgi:hypothetical protein
MQCSDVVCNTLIPVDFNCYFLVSIAWRRHTQGIIDPGAIYFSNKKTITQLKTNLYHIINTMNYTLCPTCQ